jgi:hypothetical protein
MRLLTTTVELTMRSIQEKINADITKKFEQYEFEPVVVKMVSNVGYWSIQPDDECYEHGRVHFNFQGSYNIFSITIGDRKIESQPGRVDYFDFHINTSENDKYQNFIEIVDKTLNQLRDDLNAE